MKSNLRDLIDPVLFLLSILIVVICVLQVFAITINPASEDGVQFVVGNKIYSTASAMKFNKITIASSYIVFNTTRFSVVSARPVKISLVYLNPNIPLARDGEKIVEFDATMNNGLILITLSGFPKDASYSVNANVHILSYRLGKHLGDLVFFTRLNGTQRFTIIKVHYKG